MIGLSEEGEGDLDTETEEIREEGMGQETQKLKWCRHKPRNDKDCCQPLESSKGQGKILPCRIPRQYGPTDLLILNF